MHRHSIVLNRKPGEIAGRWDEAESGKRKAKSERRKVEGGRDLLCIGLTTRRGRRISTCPNDAAGTPHPTSFGYRTVDRPSDCPATTNQPGEDALGSTWRLKRAGTQAVRTVRGGAGVPIAGFNRPVANHACSCIVFLLSRCLRPSLHRTSSPRQQAPELRLPTHDPIARHCPRLRVAFFHLRSPRSGDLD